MRRLTPHLGNLLSANQFFDTLGRPLSYDAAAFLYGIRQRVTANGKLLYERESMKTKYCCREENML